MQTSAEHEVRPSDAPRGGIKRPWWPLTAAIVLAVLTVWLSLDSATSLPHEREVRRWVGIPLAVLLVVLSVVLLARGVRSRGWVKAVVFCLAAILFGVSFAASCIGGQDNGIRGKSSANMRQLADWLEWYAAEHGGEFPQDLAVFREKYGTLRCYSYWNFAPYLYYVQGLSKDDPNDWVLFYEDPGNRVSGGMLGYVSGRVEFLRTPEYVRALDRFRAAYQAARGRPPEVVRYGP